jgi:hypothetical protein
LTTVAKATTKLAAKFRPPAEGKPDASRSSAEGAGTANPEASFARERGTSPETMRYPAALICFEPTDLWEAKSMHRIGKALTIALAAVFIMAVATLTTLAASEFEGVWKVKDTQGQPFEITLSQDGAAKATRGEGMVGTWKEEDKAAVIKWNTGWTTKIIKEGDQYKKIAYEKGQPLDGPSTNTSDAQKAK